MSLSKQIAKHMRDVHFGGNWTVTNMRDVLADVTWQQATVKVGSFNTIATLVFHTHYFVREVTKVLQGEPLRAHDKYSFEHPPIASPEDWAGFLATVWSSAETFADLIERLPESALGEDFTDGKYGTYYRNLQGIIEHTHYHLGQIVILKKLVAGGGMKR